MRVKEIETAEYWATGPAYDTPEYWRLVLSQVGDRLITGVGLAGPIRCTRQYAEHRLELLRQRAIAARRPAAPMACQGEAA